MIPTIGINGGKGEVMAPVPTRPGEFIRGKRVYVKIKPTFFDNDMNGAFEEALRGVKVSTIFGKQQLVEQLGEGFKELPDNCRVAYREDVACALEADERPFIANQFRNDGEELELVVFLADQFDIIE